ncbi:MAG: SLC13 family permease [Pseudomonadota bacterium]
MRQRIGLLLGPLLFVLFLLLPTPEAMSPAAQRLAAVTLLMAVWWMCEALPIAATALLPIVLFPLLGIMPTAQTTSAYANPMVYLFLGGFLIAMAMQRWALHRRIALHTINQVGTSPRRIILGFMLATAFLSMWISNTATAMMMLPIGLAVIAHRQASDEDGDFATALMLSIAYAASIGGVATLIGTPPNAILAGVLQEQTGVTLGFAQWMIFALPLSIVMLLVAWLYLTHIIYRGKGEERSEDRALLQDQLRKLGQMSYEERWVMVVFSLVASGWILRGLLDISWLEGVGDASIAICGALLLFVLPAGSRTGGRLLDWQSAVKLPWEILILFGGGFSLAAGFVHSGLTEWLVNQLGLLQGVPVWLLLSALVLMIIFLTEVTSNTATATIILPLMGALAGAFGLAPTLLMVPAAIAASYAFMLPVATPPNAIVFSGGHVTIPQMARAGIWMNLIATLLICGAVLLSLSF